MNSALWPLHNPPLESIYLYRGATTSLLAVNGSLFVVSDGEDGPKAYPQRGLEPDIIDNL